MKKTVLILFLLIIQLSSYSQLMTVHRTNGLVDEYSIYKVWKMTVSNDTMKVIPAASLTISYPLSQIKQTAFKYKATSSYVYTGIPIITPTKLIPFKDSLLYQALLSDTVINSNMETPEDADTLDLYECMALTSLNIAGLKINDLTGVENFPNLRYLNIQYTKVKTIDLTLFKNLQQFYAANNDSLISIKADNLAFLERVECLENRALQMIDLTNSYKLNYIKANENKLQSLDISTNKNLLYLYCSGNEIPQLDLSTHTKLRALECRLNVLQTLNLPATPDLKTIDCAYNQLESLALDGLVDLQTLYCSNNKLKNFNTAVVDSLIKLNCSYNELTVLDIKNHVKLVELDCSYNNLLGLDLSNHQNIKTIYCDSNNIALLNLSNTKKLYTLSFFHNPLETIDLSRSTYPSLIVSGFDKLYTINLTGSDILSLDCNFNNSLSQLKIDSTSRLQLLYLRSNPSLINFDFSKSTKIEKLIFENTPYTYLDFSPLINLKELECNSNTILTGINVTNLQALTKLTYCSNPLAHTVDVTSNKNLTQLYCFDNAIMDSIKINGATSLNLLDCYNNNLKTLDLTGAPILQLLNCKNNKLTELKVSGMVPLISLNCEDNLFTNLTCDLFPYLKYLTCNNNKLTALNVSNSLYLKELLCEKNNLTSLDLSRNSKLEKLFVSNNKLTQLNIKNGNTFAILLEALFNPALTCIQVDNVSYENQVKSWVDPTATFSTNCGYAAIEEYEKNISLMMYPNPVSSMLKIELAEQNQSQENINVEILNSYGLLVHSTSLALNNSKSCMIDVSMLPPGSYYVHLKYGEQVVTEKMYVIK